MTREFDLQKSELDNLNQTITRYKKKDDEFNKILELESQKTQLWKTRAEDITLKYVTVEESRTKRDFGFILMGIGLTVLAGWTVGQASR
jgi:hypothetical protein